MLVIDEAWSLIQHEDSARFLYGLIKRARKYYLGVTTITQDVEDFVNSPYGKPIITNASLQVLLKQSPTAVDNLQKIFYLTDGEKYLLLNSEVGQGLFFAGNRHVAIQIVASPKEAEIITTNPEEMLVKQHRKKFENDQRVNDAKKSLQAEKEMEKEITENLEYEDAAQEPFAEKEEQKDDVLEDAMDPIPQETQEPLIPQREASDAPMPEQSKEEEKAKEQSRRVRSADDLKKMRNITLKQATKPSPSNTKKQEEDKEESSPEDDDTPMNPEEEQPPSTESPA
jgi:hypothetical protein